MSTVSFDSQPDESTRSQGRSPPDIRQTCVSRGTVMQLLCKCHSLYPSPHFDRLHSTLACSLILSRIDYCNALLHGTPDSSIQKLEHVQNITSGGLFCRHHGGPTPHHYCVPVGQRITNKFAVLSFKFHCTATFLRFLYRSPHHSPRLWMHSALLYSFAIIRTIPQDFIGTSLPLDRSKHLELSAKHRDNC